MNLKSNIMLCGHLSDRRMEPVLIDIFARMINDFPVYPDSSYAPQYLPIRAEVEKMHYTIDLYPDILAEVDLHENQMCVTVFPVFTFLNIAEFAQPITDFLACHDTTSTEAVMRKIQQSCAADGGKSIRALFEIWKTCEAELDTSLSWSTNSFPDNPMSDYLVPCLKFIIRHEMSHWNLSRMSGQFRARIFQQTRQHMQLFMNTQTAFSTAQTRDFRRFLHSPEVERSWLEELSADTMSFMAMLHECGGNAYAERDFYISLALSYAMLKLTEVYSFYEKGNPIPYETHPPISFREHFLEFAVAREMNLSKDVFIRDIYSANLYVRIFFDSLIDAYLQRRL